MRGSISAAVVALVAIGAGVFALAADGPPAPRPRDVSAPAATAEAAVTAFAPSGADAGRGATSPAARTPMRGTRMKVHGFVAIKDGKGAREEALPPSPLGAGEYPERCWVAPDSTMYAIGKLYTGRPGPDEGVVWRRNPTGKWSIVYRLPERTFHTIVGRSDREVVVGAFGGIVTFDGSRWLNHEAPTAARVDVALVGGAILAQDSSATAAWELTGGKLEPRPVRPRRAETTDPRVCAGGGAHYRLFERSTSLGEEDLSPAEEAEVRAEFEQVQQVLDARAHR